MQGDRRNTVAAKVADGVAVTLSLLRSLAARGTRRRRVPVSEMDHPPSKRNRSYTMSAMKDHLRAVPPTRKTGDEPFSDGVPVSDFWAWDGSDLLTNDRRGRL